ncbi:MAG TPA: type VI secretion system protein TssA [Polyangia bacterium]|nr:type VI secretion system protein TssA [Polyangia bacterium]
MPLASLDTFLAPISGPDPCGPNMENDPAFVEFEISTRGKPERQMGKTIQPAEDPDWKALTRNATGLFAHTKDLRVCVHLARALLRTDGLTGLSQGLTLVSGIVQGYWDGVHPRLDPEDGNDPTMRISILAMLAAPDVIAAIRTTPIVSSRRVGRFSFKEIEALQAKANGGSSPNVEAAIMDCELEPLQADAAAAAGALAAVKNLEAAVAQRVTDGSFTDVEPLRTLLQKVAGFLEVALARRAPPVVAGPATAEGSPEAGKEAGQEVPAMPSPSVPGEIRSREDVLQALSRISGYYQQHEPSSPVPLFIERCKRLVTMSFIDIVKDLVPDAVKQVEVLKGKSE